MAKRVPRQLSTGTMGMEQNMPKHSFICWLTMQKKLLTKDRLGRRGMNTDGLCRGMNTDGLCVLCGDKQETIEHLFYECQFSNGCIGIILEWLKIKGQLLWRRVARKMAGKLSGQFAYAALAATNYYVWKGRNEAVWKSSVPKPHKVCEQIKEECKILMVEVLNKRTKGNDGSWIEGIYRQIERNCTVFIIQLEAQLAALQFSHCIPIDVLVWR